jgi:hypothetical protein
MQYQPATYFTILLGYKPVFSTRSWAVNDAPVQSTWLRGAELQLKIGLEARDFSFISAVSTEFVAPQIDVRLWL